MYIVADIHIYRAEKAGTSIPTAVWLGGIINLNQYCVFLTNMKIFADIYEKL